MLDLTALKNGPGSRLELLPEPSTDALAEALVAFANTDGGMVVIGLDTSGEFVGHAYSEDLEATLREAEQQCRPPVVIGNWEQFETEQGSVVAIRVPRSMELHALEDGRVLVRSTPAGSAEYLTIFCLGGSSATAGCRNATTLSTSNVMLFDSTLSDSTLPYSAIWPLARASVPFRI